ncbi:MAG: DNA repair protein RecO [Candidatus Sumerlaeaceae bacterium]
MPRHKSRAFVLSAADYRETSKLLQLFCESEGRISVIARGLRSPKSRKAQIADTFNLLQVTYTLKDGATLGMLTGLEPESLYSKVRSNLDAYALASYWFEILKVAGQARLASHGVFRLTQSFLESLQDAASLNTLSVQLFLDFAQELGFGIQLFECGGCGVSSDIRRFNIASGVSICGRCQSPPGRSLPIPESLIPKLSRSADGLSKQINSSSAALFLQLYNEFMSTHLEHRFGTFAFLIKCIT